MAAHMKKLTWSTRALLVMMVSVIVYGFAEVWCYSVYSTFLPMEYTTLFAAVFVSEIGAMAWVKVSKEKKPNTYLENLGIYGSTLADVAETENKPNGVQDAE